MLIVTLCTKDHCIISYLCTPLLHSNKFIGFKKKTAGRQTLVVSQPASEDASWAEQNSLSERILPVMFFTCPYTGKVCKCAICFLKVFLQINTE